MALLTHRDPLRRRRRAGALDRRARTGVARRAGRQRRASVDRVFERDRPRRPRVADDGTTTRTSSSCASRRRRSARSATTTSRQQTIAQRAAAAAGVAIAAPELVTDPQWLGAPFVVMPRVRGHIIGEVARPRPVAALARPSAQRAQVHEGFVGAVATTHRADLAAAAGVPARDNEAELDFWADYLDWSSGGAPVPALVDALAWCRAHRPATESEPVLLWGDVRLGNVIFGDDLAPRRGARLGHGVDRRARARRRVVHHARDDDAHAARPAPRRLSRSRRNDRAVRVAQRAHAARLRVVRDPGDDPQHVDHDADRLSAPRRRTAEPVADRRQPAPRPARRAHRRGGA